MKRALLTLGKVAAIVVVPGALVALGVAALYRFLFQHEDRLSDEWLRDIHAAEGAEAFARDMDESRIIRPRVSLPVHPGIESRYTEPVK